MCIYSITLKVFGVKISSIVWPTLFTIIGVARLSTNAPLFVGYSQIYNSQKIEGD